MEKILTLIITILSTCAIYAQKDITKFLGIPIDGFKSEMKQKLIAKGFTDVSGEDFLKGEFNGQDVIVSVVTNNNKVYRIVVMDIVQQNESDIKTRFNNLVRQFENNKRYASLSDFTIADSEDISYEMTISNVKKITCAGFLL